MKQRVSQIFLAFLLVLIGISLTVFLLVSTGTLHVGISAINHYRLNETEAKLVEDWISRFHKNVEDGNYDAIREELVKNKQDVAAQDAQLKNAKFAFDKYGKIDSIKFFRSTVPEPASQFYKNDLEGNVYGLFYHSNAERGRLSEHFELIINNNEVSLLRYSGDEMREWEIEANNKEGWRERELPNEIRIPLGERVLEIRY